MPDTPQSYFNLQPELTEKVIMHLHTDCTKPQCAAQVSALELILMFKVHVYTSDLLFTHSSPSYLPLSPPLTLKCFLRLQGTRCARPSLIISLALDFLHLRCSDDSIDVAFRNFLVTKRRTFSQRLFWAGIEM
jgi:hypothetical protein